MSDKTPSDKLLIKPGATLWVSDPARIELIEPLPEGVTLVDGHDTATTALVFADDAASVRRVLDASGPSLQPPEATNR